MNPLLILSTYKNMIIGGAFISLALFATIQSYRLNSCKANLANSVAQSTILSSTIEYQNKSIQEIQEIAVKRTASGIKALKGAKAISLHQQGKINSLNKALGTVKSCDSAVDVAKANL